MHYSLHLLFSLSRLSTDDSYTSSISIGMHGITFGFCAIFIFCFIFFCVFFVQTIFFVRSFVDAIWFGGLWQWKNSSKESGLSWKIYHVNRPIREMASSIYYNFYAWNRSQCTYTSYMRFWLFVEEITLFSFFFSQSLGSLCVSLTLIRSPSFFAIAGWRGDWMAIIVTIIWSVWNHFVLIMPANEKET